MHEDFDHVEKGSTPIVSPCVAILIVVLTIILVSKVFGWI